MDYKLELTPAEMKVTHTALTAMLHDFGHDERDVQALIRSVLVKLPAEDELRAVDLGLSSRARRSATPT